MLLYLHVFFGIFYIYRLNTYAKWLSLLKVDEFMSGLMYLLIV